MPDTKEYRIGSCARCNKTTATMRDRETSPWLCNPCRSRDIFSDLFGRQYPFVPKKDGAA